MTKILTKDVKILTKDVKVSYCWEDSFCGDQETNNRDPARQIAVNYAGPRRRSKLKLIGNAKHSELRLYGVAEPVGIIIYRCDCYERKTSAPGSKIGEAIFSTQ